VAEKEKFLSRWLRLKRQAAAASAPADGAAQRPEPAELPAVDSLGFDSDFTCFLQAKVDEQLKQAALKKLFHSPHFNAMDGLDVYIDDYNKFEPLPPEALRELNHAKNLLYGDEDRSDELSTADGTPAAGPSSDERPESAAATDAPPVTPVSNLTPKSESSS